ncbi:MAG: hypothetical protein C4297_05020 [Gemmataceae bacterium]
MTPARKTSLRHKTDRLDSPVGKVHSPAMDRQVPAVWRTLLTVLGSLHLAVIGLALFACVLALGTFVESWYGTPAAGQLIYRTWWFVGLLTLLAVNILCAALKKYPWKKHQTGFLITHAGLITMLAGGVLTSLFGVDARIDLMDSDDPQMLAYARRVLGGSVPRESHMAYEHDTQTLVVEWQPADAKTERQTGRSLRVFELRPGVVPWRLPDNATPPDLLVRLLGWLEHPLPRRPSFDIGNGYRLEVLNYYPAARLEPYSPASPGDAGFPAINVHLTTGRMAFPLREWLALDGRRREVRVGPAWVEFLGYCSRELIEEFLQPPTQRGSKGVLTVVTAQDKRQLPVDEYLDRTVTFAEGRLRMVRYVPDFQNPQADKPAHPILEVEWQPTAGRSRQVIVLARLTGSYFDIAKHDTVAPGRDMPHLWFHPPDWRYGQEDEVRGLLQFVQCGEQLYFRSLALRDGLFGLEKSGPVTPGAEEVPIWTHMGFRFRVAQHIPRAQAVPRFALEDSVPRPERAMSSEAVAALQCRLVHVATGRTTEFWLGQNLSPPQRFELGDAVVRISYGFKEVPLPFSVYLERAVKTVDPGTQRPASYTSYVRVADRPEQQPADDRTTPASGQRYVITMNEPLEYAGYKVYQADFGEIGIDDRGRPVNRSGFQVGYDPGLPLKYLGSIMLAAGIACMFYMRAYFFKPRRPSIPGQSTDGVA